MYHILIAKKASVGIFGTAPNGEKHALYSTSILPQLLKVAPRGLPKALDPNSGYPKDDMSSEEEKSRERAWFRTGERWER